MPTGRRARQSCGRAGVCLAVVVAALVLASAACAGRDAGTESVTGSGPVAESLPQPTGSAPDPAPSATGSQPGTSVPGSAPVTTPAPPPASTTAPTTAAAPAPTTAAPPVTHEVATTTLSLTDTSRKTVSRGSVVAASRSLPTTVYYPTDGGPYPLVVFAHGFEIGPGPYAHLCRVLAAGGYVVAAPSFPLTDKAAAGVRLDRGDLPNQAADVSFVLTAVANASRDGGPAGVLTGKVDATRFGVVGHSDGADTALDVGYYPGRADARVRAVAAFAPDAMTGPGGSVGGGTPLLLEHGDRDTIVPYANSTTVWRQVTAHRFFLTLLGADHLPPVQGTAPWAPALERVTLDFLDRYVAGRTTGDQAIVDHGRVAGVASLDAAG